MRRLTGLPRSRERRAQLRLMGLIERRYRDRFASEIANASQEMVAQYRRDGSAPDLPLGHAQTIEQIFQSLVVDAVRTFGGRVTDQGKARGLVLEAKSFAEFFQRIAVEYITQEAMRRRITYIAETTRANIIRQIQRGQDEGDSVDAIAKGIADNVRGISRQRGRLIARTETHGAANAGADAAARSTGLTLRKEWMAAIDDRTRRISDGDAYGHLSMDGEIVAMDQPFQMPTASGGFIPAAYPGDPNLPPGASINCRCTVAHLVDDGF